MFFQSLLANVPALMFSLPLLAMNDLTILMNASRFIDFLS